MGASKWVGVCSLLYLAEVSSAGNVGNMSTQHTMFDALNYDMFSSIGYSMSAVIPLFTIALVVAVFGVFFSLIAGCIGVLYPVHSWLRKSVDNGEEGPSEELVEEKAEDFFGLGCGERVVRSESGFFGLE